MLHQILIINLLIKNYVFRGHLPCVQYLVEQGAAMDDRRLNNLRETPMTTAARGNVPAVTWYLSTIKPAQQLEFKAKRRERETKLGLVNKEAAAADMPLVDVSVHTVTQSRRSTVGGGGAPPRR